VITLRTAPLNMLSFSHELIHFNRGRQLAGDEHTATNICASFNNARRGRRWGTTGAFSAIKELKAPCDRHRARIS
jgi:hypothetical protein